MTQIFMPLIGVLIGGILTFLFNKKLQGDARKEVRVYDLHSEYFSESVTVKRIKADFLIRSNGDKSIKDLFEEAMSSEEGTISIEDYANISFILHFFAKVGRLRQSNLLDTKVLDSVLGVEIQIWIGEESLFEKQLVIGIEDQEEWASWFENIRKARMP